MYEGAEDRKITGKTSCLSVYWQFVEVREFCMFFSAIFSDMNLQNGVVCVRWYGTIFEVIIFLFSKLCGIKIDNHRNKPVKSEFELISIYNFSKQITNHF